MRRVFLIGLMLLLPASVAIAQTLTTDKPSSEKFIEVILKMMFPVVITAIGPLVHNFIKTWPPPAKYIIVSMASMIAGGGMGELSGLPLTPESAATMGLTGGATGQALFMMHPKDDVPEVKS